MDYSDSVNELLKTQNKLLERISNLLERQNQSSTAPREVFVNDIDHDEMRSGFLVTSHRKKLWNVQINLINEFARICKKYNLNWFISDGTLLGAIRHQGFIPWDDDVDIVMFRPDYEKFISVAFDELPEYYFMEVWYNYFLESEGFSGNSDIPTGFQVISREDKLRGYWVPDWPKFRLMDKRTTMIRKHGYKGIQGAWIDIFPLDSVPPFKDKESEINFEIARELLIAALQPEWIVHTVKTRQPTLISYDELKRILSLPFHQRGRIAENFSLKIFKPSEYVARTVYYVHKKSPTEPLYPPHKSEWFKERLYVPFEKMTFPAPAGYDGFLKNYYGDWHKPVYSPSHSKDTGVDIPYAEYLEKSAFMQP